MTTSLKTRKRCFKCGTEKPIEHFYKHPRMGDGYLNKCADCTRQDTLMNRQLRAEYYREYDRKRGWRPPSPEKLTARNAARVLAKQLCEKCGVKAEAHHEDYSKPLEVRWLCKKHHAEAHRKH